MKRHLILVFAVGLVVSDIALCQDIPKCAPRKIHKEICPGDSSRAVSAAMRGNVTLSPNWEDTQILAEFDLASATPDHDSSHGVDGRQASYHASKTKLTIVRSASTGLAIRVSRGRYAGAWLVEPCE